MDRHSTFSPRAISALICFKATCLPSRWRLASSNVPCSPGTTLRLRSRRSADVWTGASLFAPGEENRRKISGVAAFFPCLQRSGAEPTPAQRLCGRDARLHGLSSGITTVSPKNKGSEPISSSAATIKPQTIIVKGLRATARIDVSRATAAPTSRSSSNGNETADRQHEDGEKQPNQITHDDQIPSARPSRTSLMNSSLMTGEGIKWSRYRWRSRPLPRSRR